MKDDVAPNELNLDCGPCTIRPWRASDLDALVRNAHNRKIWLQVRDRFPHPYTHEIGRSWLATIATEQPRVTYAIDVDGEAAGGIGVMLGTDVERISAELGYWLGEPYWNRGIMSAAVLGFVDFAFDEYGLHRIFAVPFMTNTGSRRVLEKCGFDLEGVIRANALKDGKIMDSGLYAKIRR
jgi:[ribosomal protein S5]-alanine N-acetyltransferase